MICCLFVLQTAGRTLGDLVRKLGERVLPEIIPILEKGLDSDRSDERQGVCIGLSEIVKSTSRDMVCISMISFFDRFRNYLKISQSFFFIILNSSEKNFRSMWNEFYKEPKSFKNTITPLICIFSKSPRRQTFSYVSWGQIKNSLSIIAECCRMRRYTEKWQTYTYHHLVTFIN